MSEHKRPGSYFKFGHESFGGQGKRSCFRRHQARRSGVLFTFPIDPLAYPFRNSSTFANLPPNVSSLRNPSQSSNTAA